MKMKWKKEKSRRQYQTYEAKSGPITITITVLNGHTNSPGEWCMHCHDLRISQQPLYVDTAEEAKKEAIKIVKRSLNLMLNALKELES